MPVLDKPELWVAVSGDTYAVIGHAYGETFVIRDGFSSQEDAEVLARQITGLFREMARVARIRTSLPLVLQ